MNIVCQDCGEEFKFSVKEQDFYKKKGFDYPKRCKSCRERNNLGLPRENRFTSAFWDKTQTYGILADVKGGLYTEYGYIVKFKENNKVLYIRLETIKGKSTLKSVPDMKSATRFREYAANKIKEDLIKKGKEEVDFEIDSFYSHFRLGVD